MIEYIKETVWLALGLLGFYLALVREFQMLQQNSYYISRYLKWVFPFYRTRLIFDIIFAGSKARFRPFAP